VRQKADVGFPRTTATPPPDRRAASSTSGASASAPTSSPRCSRRVPGEGEGAAIVYDLPAPAASAEEIVAARRRPLRSASADSFIKATMRRENAPFAGELSGHFYFRDHYFSDCGTLAWCTSVNRHEPREAPLSDLIAPLRRTTERASSNFEVADPDAKVKEIRARTATASRTSSTDLGRLHRLLVQRPQEATREPLPAG